MDKSNFDSPEALTSVSGKKTLFFTPSYDTASMHRYVYSLSPNVKMAVFMSLPLDYKPVRPFHPFLHKHGIKFELNDR